MARPFRSTWPETIRWLLAWATGLWLAIAASCLVAEMLYQGFRPVWWWTTYLVLTVIASPICFAAYGSDKRRAARQLERIPERTLHLLALMGGWPGAVLGQRMFHHKTQKLSFRLILGSILLLHVGLISLGLYLLLPRAA